MTGFVNFFRFCKRNQNFSVNGYFCSVSVNVNHTVSRVMLNTIQYRKTKQQSQKKYTAKRAIIYANHSTVNVIIVDVTGLLLLYTQRYPKNEINQHDSITVCLAKLNS